MFVIIAINLCFSYILQSGVETHLRCGWI